MTLLHTRCTAFFFLFFIFSQFLGSFQIYATPLDDYVNQIDETYSYVVDDIKVDDQYMSLLITMTSQKWRNESEVDTPVWKHPLRVIIPKDVQSSTSLLSVLGGTRQQKTDLDSLHSNIIQTALNTNSVVAELFMVPNQPLQFINMENSICTYSNKTEDGFIAYCWDKFLTTKDPLWIPRLPMTKAVVRAMDTIQDVVEKYSINNLCVTDFVLAGASKRAWTVWTTAAVDKRVQAIVPICFDVRDIRSTFEKYFATYGSWSVSFQEYIKIQLPQRWYAKEFEQLMSIEGPYQLQDRVTIPKFFILGSGDEVFSPHELGSYSNDLLGQTSFLLLPNVGHRISQNLYWPVLSSYYSSIVNKSELPTISWIKSDNVITVFPSKKPSQVTLWRASTLIGKDFRLSKVGKIWSAAHLTALEDGSYEAIISNPQEGASAYFIQCDFTMENDSLYSTSTEMFILSDAAAIY